MRASEGEQYMRDRMNSRKSAQESVRMRVGVQAKVRVGVRAREGRSAKKRVRESDCVEAADCAWAAAVGYLDCRKHGAVHRMRVGRGRRIRRAPNSRRGSDV